MSEKIFNQVYTGNKINADYPRFKRGVRIRDSETKRLKVSFSLAVEPLCLCAIAPLSLPLFFHLFHQ